MGCNPTALFALKGEVAAADFVASPRLKLVADDDAIQQWQENYELLGVHMSSSLTNFGTADMGIFIILGANSDEISYGKSTPSLISHISGTNSIIGPPAVAIPSDKSLYRPFLQPIDVSHGTKIAAYAFGDTTAGNKLSFFVSFDMRVKRG